MNRKQLGIETIDEETRALIRIHSPQDSVDRHDQLWNGKRSVEVGITADIYNPAHRKTWEERYHVRTYQELRKRMIDKIKAEIECDNNKFCPYCKAMKKCLAWTEELEKNLKNEFSYHTGIWLGMSGEQICEQIKYILDNQFKGEKE